MSFIHGKECCISMVLLNGTKSYRTWDNRQQIDIKADGTTKGWNYRLGYEPLTDEEKAEKKLASEIAKRIDAWRERETLKRIEEKAAFLSSIEDDPTWFLEYDAGEFDAVETAAMGW